MTRSPLHDLNVGLGARFTDFGGWELPRRSDSVIAEHKAVRTSAGFFDVSHLGRFDLTGPGARDAIRRLLSNDIERIEPGRCQYTTMLNDEGGIIDDLIVWWSEPDRFRVLPNAANHERVMAAFAGEPETVVTDVRDGTVRVGVQGPDAPEILEHVLGGGDAKASWRHTENVFQDLRRVWNTFSVWRHDAFASPPPSTKEAPSRWPAPATPVRRAPKCAWSRRPVVLSCRRWSKPVWPRAVSVPGTRCVSRRVCPCGERTSTRPPARSRPASTSPWRWTTPSWAATPWRVSKTRD